MFCRECGVKCKDDARFCPECGAVTQGGGAGGAAAQQLEHPPASAELIPDEPAAPEIPPPEIPPTEGVPITEVIEASTGSFVPSEEVAVPQPEVAATPEPSTDSAAHSGDFPPLEAAAAGAQAEPAFAFSAPPPEVGQAGEPHPAPKLLTLFSGVFKKHTPAQADALLSSGLSAPQHAKDLSEQPWLFSRVFAALAGLAIILFLGLRYSSVASFGALLCCGLALPLALMIFFWEINRRQTVSLFDLIKLFSAAAAACLVLELVASLLQAEVLRVNLSIGLYLVFSLLGSVLAQAVGIALIIFLMRGIKSCRILDGLLLGSAVGCGFALFDTAKHTIAAYYMGTSATLAGQGLEQGFLSLGGHVVWFAIAGAMLMLVQADDRLSLETLKTPRFLRLLAIPAGLHFLWDFFRFALRNNPKIVSWLLFAFLGVVGWYFVIRLVNNGLTEAEIGKLAPDSAEANLFRLTSKDIIHQTAAATVAKGDAPAPLAGAFHPAPAPIAQPTPQHPHTSAPAAPRAAAPSVQAPPPGYTRYDHPYHKLGGWLGFIAYGQLVAVILMALLLVVGFIQTLVMYSGYFSFLGAAFWLIYAVQLVGYGFTCFFCLKFSGMVRRKNPRFLRFYEMTMLILAGIYLVVLVATGFSSVRENIAGIAQAAIMFAIWTTYFRKSVRVRTYFGSDQYLRESIFFKNAQAPMPADMHPYVENSQV